MIRFQEKINYWLQKSLGAISPAPQRESALYTSRKNFRDSASAARAFIQAREKLFNINGWNNIRTLGKTVFTLFEENGKISKAVKLSVGQYIRISSPGPLPAVWVMIHEVFEGFNMAEFTVRPAFNPQYGHEPHEHFYTTEATGIFRVRIDQNTLLASKEGNDDDSLFRRERHVADSSNLITLRSAWSYYQKYRWKHLTNYLIR